MLIVRRSDRDALVVVPPLAAVLVVLVRTHCLLAAGAVLRATHQHSLLLLLVVVVARSAYYCTSSRQCWRWLHRQRACCYVAVLGRRAVRAWLRGRGIVLLVASSQPGVRAHQPLLGSGGTGWAVWCVRTS